MVRVKAQLKWVEVRMGGEKEGCQYIDNSPEQLLWKGAENGSGAWRRCQAKANVLKLRELSPVLFQWEGYSSEEEIDDEWKKEYLCWWKGNGPRAHMEGLATDGQREYRASGKLVVSVVGRSGSWSDYTYFLYKGQSEVRLRMKEERVSKICRERRKCEIVALWRVKRNFLRNCSRIVQQFKCPLEIYSRKFEVSPSRGAG